MQMIPKHDFSPIINRSTLYATGVTRVQGVVLRRIRGSGHFRSRDKDGGNTIRFDMAIKPVQYANFTVLSSTEAELLPIEVLHCWNREFRVFFATNSGNIIFVRTPKNDTAVAETSILSHKTRKSVKRCDLCRCAQNKKVTGGWTRVMTISRICRTPPPLKDKKQSLHVG